jgi:WD40 repeat protein
MYKKLSEKSTLFDKGLTDYLKTPDLDIALTWYEQQRPDEFWCNQFDSNYQRTISYLLTSKEKYQEDILKKELAQKEKAKRLRKTILLVGSITFFILLIISALLVRSIDEELKAKKAELDAKLAKDEALKSKKKADKLFEEAQDKSREAKKEAENAKRSTEIAQGAFKKANKEKEKADSARNKAIELSKSLEEEKNKLNETVKALKTSTEKEQASSKDAENGRKYQESLYVISSLRNEVQKKEFQDDEFYKLLADVKTAYSDYSKISFEYKKASLPNNDLYQVLLEMRKKLIQKGSMKGIPEELTSMRSGLRKIIVSQSGLLATGGDDGTLLYTKKALGQGSVAFTKFSLVRDRIRSMEFVNEKELVMGTVFGKLYLFNTVTGENKLLEIGLFPDQIVEQVVNTSSGLFVLVGGKVIKVSPNALSKTAAVSKDLPKTAAIPKELPKIPSIPKELPKTAAAPKELTNAAAVPNLSAKSIFKFNEEKLLLISKDNTLVLLDMATLQWQPINNDLKNVEVTAAVSSGENLFLGMANGNVIISKNIKLGNIISIKTELIIPAHKTRITSLAYDASSNKLFSASLDQTATIFDLNLKNAQNNFIGNYTYKLEGFDKWIWDFALIQTGKVKTLLTVDESGELKSWPTDAETLHNDIYSSIKK